MLRVEVVRALPERQDAVVVEMPPGATVADALRASGLAPEGPVEAGRFGVRVGLDAPLEPGDRIEIYRPLRVDPKAARRDRLRRR